MKHINELEQVRQILGNPNEASYNKIKTSLNQSMRTFIQAAPLMMLSTVDADGFPTVSPKGDKAGFVAIRDEQTLLIPERKGNKLAFSFENLLKHPKAGLMFLVPGTPETLRVHGHCRIIHDAVLGKELESQSQEALLIIEFTVVSCYFHCAKALLRSQAWRPDSWEPRQSVSFGDEIFGTGQEQAAQARKLDEAVNARYVTDL